MARKPCDYLNLCADATLRKVLTPAGGGGVEDVLFSDGVIKINRHDVSQERLIAVTSGGVYNLNKSRKVKRRIDISRVDGVTVSQVSDEFVVHVPSEYDYRFSSPRKAEAVECIQAARLSATGVTVPVHYTSALHLKDVVMTKDKAVLGGGGGGGVVPAHIQTASTTGAGGGAGATTTAVPQPVGSTAFEMSTAVGELVPIVEGNEDDEDGKRRRGVAHGGSGVSRDVWSVASIPSTSTHRPGATASGSVVHPRPTPPPAAAMATPFLAAMTTLFGGGGDTAASLPHTTASAPSSRRASGAGVSAHTITSPLALSTLFPLARGGSGVWHAAAMAEAETAGPSGTSAPSSLSRHDAAGSVAAPSLAYAPDRRARGWVSHVSVVDGQGGGGSGPRGRVVAVASGGRRATSHGAPKRRGLEGGDASRHFPILPVPSPATMAHPPTATAAISANWRIYKALLRDGGTTSTVGHGGEGGSEEEEEEGEGRGMEMEEGGDGSSRGLLTPARLQRRASSVSTAARRRRLRREASGSHVVEEGAMRASIGNHGGGGIHAASTMAGGGGARVEDVTFHQNPMMGGTVLARSTGARESGGGGPIPTVPAVQRGMTRSPSGPRPRRPSSVGPADLRGRPPRKGSGDGGMALTLMFPRRKQLPLPAPPHPASQGHGLTAAGGGGLSLAALHRGGRGSATRAAAGRSTGASGPGGPTVTGQEADRARGAGAVVVDDDEDEYEGGVGDGDVVHDLPLFTSLAARRRARSAPRALMGRSGGGGKKAPFPRITAWLNRAVTPRGRASGGGGMPDADHDSSMSDTSASDMGTPVPATAGGMSPIARRVLVASLKAAPTTGAGTSPLGRGIPAPIPAAGTASGGGALTVTRRGNNASKRVGPGPAAVSTPSSPALTMPTTPNGGGGVHTATLAGASPSRLHGMAGSGGPTPLDSGDDSTASSASHAWRRGLPGRLGYLLPPTGMDPAYLSASSHDDAASILLHSATDDTDGEGRRSATMHILHSRADDTGGTGSSQWFTMHPVPPPPPAGGMGAGGRSELANALAASDVEVWQRIAGDTGPVETVEVVTRTTASTPGWGGGRGDDAPRSGTPPAPPAPTPSTPVPPLATHHIPTPASNRPAAPAITLAAFQYLRLLGRGSYGKVVQVRKKDTGEVFAMKILNKARVVARLQVDHTQTERAILESVDHPFLVKLRYAFQSSKSLYMVLPFCAGGELFQRLRVCRRLDEGAARFYAAEIALGLGHLHAMGIIYRDTKPENVLLDAEGHVKLTDYGLAKVLADPDDATTTFCGTPEYLAPEVLAGTPHTRAVDWYALGVFVWELLAGVPPFTSRTNNAADIYAAVRRGLPPFPAHFTPLAQSFIRDLTHADPAARLGCRPQDHDVLGVQRHPFFAGVDWEAVEGRRVAPPWVPTLTDPADVSNFDREFTMEPAPMGVSAGGGSYGSQGLPSLADSVPGFDGFTYASDGMSGWASSASESRRGGDTSARSKSAGWSGVGVAAGGAGASGWS